MNNPLVQPDPGLFFWTILTFLALLALLAKFAWVPLLAALAQRQKTIAGALEDAQKAKEELQRVQQDAQKLLSETRREADGILTRARGDADKFREEMRAQAAAQATTIVKNAERRIQEETARALVQLRRESVNLSFEIASKILRRTVSPADHERLVEEMVTKLEHPPN